MEKDLLSCGHLLLVPRDSEAQCSELRTLLLTSPTQILALWGTWARAGFALGK